MNGLDPAFALGGSRDSRDRLLAGIVMKSSHIVLWVTCPRAHPKLSDLAHQQWTPR